VPITAEGTGALLFLGYFDQTDVFFTMVRVLSTNMKQLDKALEQKSKDDMPSFGIPLRAGKGITVGAALRWPTPSFHVT
jgi:hypothetical protein